jgi:cyclohexanone monooxygenase
MENANSEDIEIDIAALTLRYEQERQKRLRTDGLDQYRKLTGEFAHLGKDRRADEAFTREPVTADSDVLIMGGGIGGLLVAARLREQGVKDIRIVDRAGDFGGTWYWNRYPGARCDVESYIYMPLLEETGFLPTEKYATAPEIYEHAQRIGKHYDLYGGALFQTAITGVEWDATAARWIIATDRGDRIAARFFVSCKGLFTNPKLPNIPGIDGFEGAIFHTSRWDYDYTGGAADGRLTKLGDKQVGVIGTGSTGIQCVPPLAEYAQDLYIFQRTPTSIDVRGNRPTDPEWQASLGQGWQRERMENFTYITVGVPQPVNMVADSWTDILRDVGSTTAGNMAAADPIALQRAQMVRMEKVRRRVDSIVADKATADALKPYFHYFCKRPGFSDHYLDIYNRPNVHLIDTGGRGVERVTKTGVVVAGKEYPIDCLVLATGFEFMIEYTKEVGFDMVGRDGMKLSQYWGDGTRTLFAIHIHNFPNLFMLSLVQAGISMNYTHTAEEQAQHIAGIIGRCLREGIETVEATAQAEKAWVDAIVANAPTRRTFLDACTPSYYNYEGKRERAFEQNEPYPGGPVAYYELLHKWRADGGMEGLEVHKAS